MRSPSGTETDGSVVCPSSVNGIVGIKPTVGLVSRSGVIPVSHSQDTPGPMARTVADAAVLLTALAGADERDAATTGARVEPDYAAFVDPDGLRGARIGVARNLAGFNDRVDRLFEDAIAAMRALGAEIVDPTDIPHADELEDPELEVFLYEFKADLEAYLGSLGPSQPYRTLADLIAFDTRARRTSRCRSSGRSCSSRPPRRGRSPSPSTSRRSRRVGGSRERRASTR